jgi:DnaJ family protein C protein 3
VGRARQGDPSRFHLRRHHQAEEEDAGGQVRSAEMARPWRLMLPLLVLYSPIVYSQEAQDNDPSTLFKRASEMMSLRKYDGALGLLNAVLEVDPNHSEAYRQRASVLRQRCSYKEAESDYNKYMELKPGTASVEKELSQLLQAKMH